jgi:hypothetical protein
LSDVITNGVIDNNKDPIAPWGHANPPQDAVRRPHLARISTPERWRGPSANSHIGSF